MDQSSSSTVLSESAHFGLAAFILALLLLPGHVLFTNDTWWHLALGDDIIAVRGIPAEMYSFTARGQAIFCHWWLSDVIFSAITSAIGLGGFEIFGLMLVTALLFTTAFLARALGASPKQAIVALVLCFLVTKPFLILRPQLFSALLLMWIFIFYLQWRAESPRRFFAFPLLFAAWANLHGGFILGLLLLAALSVFELGVAAVDGAAASRARFLVPALLLAVVACCLNPYGLAVYSNALQHDPFVRGANQNIDEWLAPTLRQAPWMYASIVVAVICVATRKAQPRLLEAAVFFGATVAATLSWRHSLLFGIFAVPVLSVWLTRVTAGRLRPELPMPSSVSLRLAGILLVALLCWGALVRQPVLETAALKKLFPIGAVDWLRQNPQRGNMFNAYQWGGYLIYVFRGQPPVYIDSRLAPYLHIFPGEYFRIWTLAEGWKEILQQRSISWAVIPARSELRQNLESREGWSQLYADETAAVLRAP